MRQFNLFFILLFFSLFAFADELIIEPEMGLKPVNEVIDSAKHSVYLTMYGFTHQTLLASLIEKRAKGRTVKVLLEAKPYKMNDLNIKTINLLKKNRIAWQGKIPPYRLIHQKTLIIDNQKALVMTFNFTHSTFKNDRNFGLLIDDAKTVHAIQNIFNADNNHVPALSEHPALLLSPDNSRQKLLEIIARAKSQIQIYAQSVSDFKIVGALADAARKGVKIDILTSQPIREKQAAFLKAARVNVHFSKKRYIHAKVMIIDNQKAVVGSINLTRASLDDNRELAVITQDKKVVRKLMEIFARDLTQASGRNYKPKTVLTMHWKKYLREVEHLLKRVLS